ncbi:hypothetical protein P3X46_028286 [Hevea brasiliensis]|uniref:Uncharacterized protein n=1 Tax=Hevea brasiliensis TaxID=3981 RepID=A0ABQ9KNH7_HEVBR|nr:hypothetical protein P3X46_028286 [Hevea brasiliensis]
MPETKFAHVPVTAVAITNDVSEDESGKDFNILENPEEIKELFPQPCSKPEGESGSLTKGICGMLAAEQVF